MPSSNVDEEVGLKSASPRSPPFKAHKARRVVEASNSNNNEQQGTNGSTGTGESSMGIIRWFFVALSCFIMFFVILNLSLHDMINDHSHGSSSSSSSSSSASSGDIDQGHSTLHDVRNFVMNEYNSITASMKGLTTTTSTTTTAGGEEGLRDRLGLHHKQKQGEEKKQDPMRHKDKDGVAGVRAEGSEVDDDDSVIITLKDATGDEGSSTGSTSSTSTSSNKDKDKDTIMKMPLSTTATSTAITHTQAHSIPIHQPQHVDPAHTRRSVDHLGRESSLYLSTLHAHTDHVDVNHDHHLNSRDDISAFIEGTNTGTATSGGGHIPIVLLTCNRALLLEQTLGSLFAVRGIRKEDVVVMQDGHASDVAGVVNSHGLKLVQNVPISQGKGARLRGNYINNMDGATRIALHYKFSLTTAFDLFPLAPCVIIIEDDLLFSVDFLEYFQATAPLLDIDDSLFLVSAWNDNGYTGKVDDPYALSRTEFFPGLGWLLSRTLYQEELKATWPTQHWDHWLRSFSVNKGREILTPQVPRTYHNGIKGTFMDINTHNRYFKNIAYNQNKGISWPILGSSSSSSSSSSSGTAFSISAKNVIGSDSSSSSSSTLPLLPVVPPSLTQASKSQSSIPIPIFMTALLPIYEARIESLIHSCVHIHTINELVISLMGTSTDIDTGTSTGVENTQSEMVQLLSRDAQLQQASILCIWIEVDPDPLYGSAPFESISSFFGIWHEHRRGAHRGLHEFYWRDKYIMLLNTFSGSKNSNGNGSGSGGSYNQRNRQIRSSTTATTSVITGTGTTYLQSLRSYSNYAHLLPVGVSPLSSRSFDKVLFQKVREIDIHKDMKSSHAVVIKASRAGMSCDDVCSLDIAATTGTDTGTRIGKGIAYMCKQNMLYLANTCHAMMSAFSGSGCKAGCGENLVSFGREHPAMVVSTATGQHHHPGACAISSNIDMATCNAKHDLTIRLCVCVPIP